MMLSQLPLSKKYATAYLNVYQHELPDNFIQNMMRANIFAKKHHNIMFLFSVSLIPKENKEHVLNELLQHFSLPQSLHSLLVHLINKKRMYLFEYILHDICCLYKERNNNIDLEIIASHELTDEQIESFEDFFRKLSKKMISSKVTYDSSLIGGVRLQSDTLMWEDSVASKLKRIGQKILMER